MLQIFFSKIHNIFARFSGSETGFNLFLLFSDTQGDSTPVKEPPSRQNMQVSQPVAEASGKNKFGISPTTLLLLHVC